MELDPRCFKVGALASALSVFLCISPSFAAADPVGAVDDEAQRVYRKCQESVFQIKVVDLASGKKTAIGSGFRISDEGHIATNFHVISKAVYSPDRFRVELIRDEDVLGDLDVLDIDVIHDLAVVTIREEPPPGTFLPLGKSLLAKGQRLYSMGNPHDIGMTIVEGTYNGLKERSMYRRILFTGSINPGMSGGPALDREGTVVGVNVSTAGNQVSFLVPVEYLQDLFSRSLLRERKDLSWDERMQEQLIENQDLYMGEILRSDWEMLPIGKGLVPGEVLKTLTCWGESHDVEHDLYRHADIICSNRERIHLSGSLSTGQISFKYRWMESGELNLFRFYSLLEKSYGGNGAFGSADEDDVTNFHCLNRFVQVAGRRWKVAQCARTYRRYPLLYDTFLAAASVGEKEGALLAWVSVLGVSRENSRRFAAKFLKKIGWRE